jgi:hypothetical protein
MNTAQPRSPGPATPETDTVWGLVVLSHADHTGRLVR